MCRPAHCHMGSPTIVRVGQGRQEREAEKEEAWPSDQLFSEVCINEDLQEPFQSSSSKRLTYEASKPLPCLLVLANHCSSEGHTSSPPSEWKWLTQFWFAFVCCFW